VGIFCANFCSNHGDFKACRKVWFVKCYTVSVGDPFLIRAPIDEDGFENMVTGDEDRFKRDGMATIFSHLFSVTSATL
jgi:hypothetical protein